jgi:hypothetical protein
MKWSGGQMFGFGIILAWLILTWLIFVVMAIMGARHLRGRKE